MNKGLLLVLVDPAPMLEEELNAWYDTEHLPERAAIDGIETARRFVSIGDGPRYLAIYDLASLDVLDGAAYRAVSGEKFSPWTRRVTGMSKPLRIVGLQVWPGGAVTGNCTRLMMLRFSRASESALPTVKDVLRQSFDAHAGLVHYRVFSCGDESPGGLIALVEFVGNEVPPLATAGLGALRGQLDLVATYRPYRM